MLLDRLAPALFVLLWSTGWVAAKYATFVSGPVTFLAMRYALAIAVFVAICRWSGATWPKGRKPVLLAIISGVFLHGLYLGPLWWAIGQGVPAALSGIIAGLQPLMTAAVAPFLIGERLSLAQRAGLSLGFMGIALAVFPRLFEIDAGSVPVLPVLVNIAGMAAVTYGTIFQKKYLQQGDLRSIAALQYIGALVVTAPFALMFESQPVEFGLPLVLLLAWSVIGLSVGAIALLLYLLRRGQVSRAASLIYLVPPLAALQAALLFGEALTLPMIAGTAIAVTGVYLTNRKAVVAAE